MWACFIGNGTIVSLLITFNAAIKCDRVEAWQKNRKHIVWWKKTKEDYKTSCTIYFFLSLNTFKHGGKTEWHKQTMDCDPLWYDILFLPFFLLICLSTFSKILQWTWIPSAKKKKKKKNKQVFQLVLWSIPILRLLKGKGNQSLSKSMY